eukprot:g16718.t1
MAAFFSAVPLAPAELARRSPRRTTCSRRLRTPFGAVQTQGQGQEQGDDEDIPNLYKVTAAPTYEEMLAWAEETDERIATGRLPPLGSRQPHSAEGAAGTAGVSGGSLLSQQEQAQMATLAGLLSKRRRGAAPLSEQEEASLRAAVAGLSSSVDRTDPESVEGNSSSPASGGDAGDAGGEVAPGGVEVEDLVLNQIYGSREVRDKVYLYAWSLMKNRQEKAEREAEEQERQRRR